MGNRRDISGIYQTWALPLSPRVFICLAQWEGRGILHAVALVQCLPICAELLIKRYYKKGVSISNKLGKASLSQLNLTLMMRCYSDEMFAVIGKYIINGVGMGLGQGWGEQSPSICQT